MLQALFCNSNLLSSRKTANIRHCVCSEVWANEKQETVQRWSRTSCIYDNQNVRYCQWKEGVHELLRLPLNQQYCVKTKFRKMPILTCAANYRNEGKWWICHWTWRIDTTDRNVQQEWIFFRKLTTFSREFRPCTSWSASCKWYRYHLHPLYDSSRGHDRQKAVSWVGWSCARRR